MTTINDEVKDSQQLYNTFGIKLVKVMTTEINVKITASIKFTISQGSPHIKKSIIK